MSAQPKQQNDELYFEMRESGIDVDETIELFENFEKLCLSHSNSNKISLQNEIIKYSSELSDRERRIGNKMKMISLIIISSITGTALFASLLFFGAVSEEPWLFVTRATLVLFLTLTVFSVLALVQNMWSALLVEREMRAELEEKFTVANGILKAL